MKLAHFLTLALITSAFAQNSDPSNYTYEERPDIGAYFELGGQPSSVTYDYKIWKKHFTLDYDIGNIYGAGAHLPVNKWLGVNGFIGFQQIKFDYNLNGDSTLRQTMLDSLIITSDDLNGNLISRNLLVQAGMEAGVPFYSNYQHQLMIKALGFADGIYGKTFFDDSKFANANLFGYGYGASIRLAIGPVALEGGFRLSHIWWSTNFDPEKMTGTQINDDTFMFEYDTPVSPFFKASWSLY